MALPVHITDGRGTKHRAAVHDDGALGVIAHPEPPFLPQKTELFRQFITDDGTSTGSNDMGIDGSVTNAEFWIPAHAENDRYITKLNIVVAYAASGAPYKWADGDALTNGTEILYTSLRGERVMHDGIKANQDLMRIDESGVSTAWEVRHVNANNDYGFFTTILLSTVMPPFGMKLDAGSNQKLLVRVRDDATDAITFNMIAIGFDRFK
jgi:hypothetical protein